MGRREKAKIVTDFRSSISCPFCHFRRSLYSRYLLQKVLLQFAWVPKMFAKFGEALLRVIVDEWALLGQVLQIRRVRFGLVLDQVVVEGPGVGVRVEGRVWVAEAFAVAEHFFQRAVVPTAEVRAELFEAWVIHAANSLPAAAAREVGCFEVHG